MLAFLFLGRLRDFDTFAEAFRHHQRGIEFLDQIGVCGGDDQQLAGATGDLLGVERHDARGDAIENGAELVGDPDIGAGFENFRQFQPVALTVG